MSADQISDVALSLEDRKSTRLNSSHNCINLAPQSIIETEVLFYERLL